MKSQIDFHDLYYLDSLYNYYKQDIASSSGFQTLLLLGHFENICIPLHTFVLISKIYYIFEMQRYDMHYIINIEILIRVC